MPLTRTYPTNSIHFEDLHTSTEEFVHTLGELAPLLDIPLIQKAYQFAWEAHKNQRRKSGELYIGHPVAVALICATQNMDTTTVVASLLHDVVEDTPITKEQIAENFGEAVAQLVDGVTKIESLAHQDKQEQQAETYRKMLITTAQDIRVIIIKFADRIHNLQTLKHMPQHKRVRIAQESLDIYAPLAHRLGMRAIKVDLEDLSFQYLNPADYEEVRERVTSRKDMQEEVLASFNTTLENALEKSKVHVDIIGRQKHFYSIYLKHTARNVPYDEIYDILAMRVICGTREECYQVLGVIHNLWTPVPDKLKDYIANIKPNGYQSLHTTVSDSMGNVMEIQIRTWEMHYVAEEGVAAHWRYKNGDDSRTAVEDTGTLSWLRNLVEWQQELSDSVEFYEFFKIDIDHQGFSCYTPKKREVPLPKGATVLDFAYAIHSELGNHCIGAKVNGLVVEGRSHHLKSGDVVQIFTDQDNFPKIGWLTESRTPRARSAIKRWLSKEKEATRITMGRKLLYSSFEQLHSSSPLSTYMDILFEKFALEDENDLYDQIGSAQLEIDKVLAFLTSTLHEEKPKIKQILQGRKGGQGKKGAPHVIVNGMDDTMIRYATCCHPVPGDTIVGFLTTGRGISVHRKDCAYAEIFSQDKERAIMLTWDFEKSNHNLKAPLTLKVKDRKGVIKDITSIIEQYDFNIVSLSTELQDSTNYIHVKVQTKEVRDLHRLCNHLRRIRGVIKVSRDKTS